ncbi:MAG: metal-dependent hydrolase [Cyanobacteria bacterium J06621_11]
MSSFIGHGLAAVTTHAIVQPRSQPFHSPKSSLLWLAWLIIIAWMPDIDYLLPSLTLANNNGMRITHAVFSSLLLPAFTTFVLYVIGLRKPRLNVAALQSAIAGLSHPLMDWCVGVIGLPLLWPVHPAVFTAPIGLLPSAGTPHWQNYYFYSNLLIELGIIVPLMIVVLRNLPWQKNRLSILQSVALVAIAAYFLHWSIGLSR